jgi:serine/threonine protein kinase
MKPLIAMIMIATQPPETVTGRSEELRQFLGLCLQKDPKDRATAQRLLAHPFITRIGSGEGERERFLEMLQEMQHAYI